MRWRHGHHTRYRSSCLLTANSYAATQQSQCHTWLIQYCRRTASILSTHTSILPMHGFNTTSHTHGYIWLPYSRLLGNLYLKCIHPLRLTTPLGSNRTFLLVIAPDSNRTSYCGPPHNWIEYGIQQSSIHYKLHIHNHYSIPFYPHITVLQQLLQFTTSKLSCIYFTFHILIPYYHV